jgi:hypothetical protein
MREALDPRSKSLIALPPSSELKADLCAGHFKITPGGIQVESKEDIKKRIGRSTDLGDAYLLAHMVTERTHDDDEDYYYDVGSRRDGVTGY